MEKKPKEIKKRDIEESDAEDFFVLLQMYGSIIKNAELLDNKDKIEHLEYYMYGMNMLYAMMIKLLDYMQQKFKYADISDGVRRELEIDNEDEFEEIKFETVEFVKLFFPIAIQNIILENVGTPKLEAAIKELIKMKRGKSFETFMLTFLNCDLKIGRLKGVLEEYIKQEKSKSVLKIALIKLTYYYRSRFFGNNVRIDAELIDLITEIHTKVSPQRFQNLLKSKIAKDIKFELDNR